LQVDSGAGDVRRVGSKLVQSKLPDIEMLLGLLRGFGVKVG
jgi:hypothetical protein